MEARIKYATMIVENMEESVNFYQDVMGFEIDSRYDPAPGISITLMKSRGETMIELIKDNVHKVGFYDIGMEVEDMEATVAELKSKGVKILQEPQPTLVGSFALAEDPNGVRIGFIKHD